jgi:hypothetical protein
MRWNEMRRKEKDEKAADAESVKNSTFLLVFMFSLDSLVWLMGRTSMLKCYFNDDAVLIIFHGKKGFRFEILLAASRLHQKWNETENLFLCGVVTNLYSTSLVHLSLSNSIQSQNRYKFVQLTQLSSSALIPKWYQMKSRKIKLLQHSRF